jgi:hypothetical protein
MWKLSVVIAMCATPVLAQPTSTAPIVCVPHGAEAGGQKWPVMLQAFPTLSSFKADKILISQDGVLVGQLECDGSEIGMKAPPGHYTIRIEQKTEPDSFDLLAFDLSAGDFSKVLPVAVPVGTAG